MNRLTRTVLTATLMVAPAALILTGCAKSAPDSVLLPAVQETPSPTSPAYAQAIRAGMSVALFLQHRSELGLTDAQVARLEAIRDRLQQQNQPLLAQLREAGVMPRRDRMRAGMQQMTPEQRQEMRQQMQERRERLTPAEREQMRIRMQERMEQRMRDLTPEQREQMEARLQERMQQMTPEEREAMRRRMQEMTPEQRQEKRARMHEQRAQAAPRTGAGAEQRVPENLRPVVRQIQQNHRAAMQEARAVLTSEQQEQMRELMQEHRRSMMLQRDATRGPGGPRGMR